MDDVKIEAIHPLGKNDKIFFIWFDTYNFHYTIDISEIKDYRLSYSGLYYTLFPIIGDMEKLWIKPNEMYNSILWSSFLSKLQLFVLFDENQFVNILKQIQLNKKVDKTYFPKRGRI